MERCYELGEYQCNEDKTSNKKSWNGMLAHYQRCDLAILSISGQLMQGATMACGLTKRTTGNIVSGHTISYGVNVCGQKISLHP